MFGMKKNWNKIVLESLFCAGETGNEMSYKWIVQKPVKVMLILATWTQQLHLYAHCNTEIIWTDRQLAELISTSSGTS